MAITWYQIRTITEMVAANGDATKTRVTEVALTAIMNAETTIANGLENLERRIAEVRRGVTSGDAVFRSVPGEIDAAIAVKATNWQLLGVTLTQAELEKIQGMLAA
jgi:hypothetical protein